MSNKREDRPQLGGLNTDQASKPDRPKTAGETAEELDDDAYHNSMNHLSSQAGFKSSRSQSRHPAAAHVTSAKVAPTERAREPRKSRRKPTIQIEVPNYLRQELAITAAQRDVTIRYLLLEALREVGYTVRDEDLFADGRRERGLE